MILISMLDKNPFFQKVRGRLQLKNEK